MARVAAVKIIAYKGIDKKIIAVSIAHYRKLEVSAASKKTAVHDADVIRLDTKKKRILIIQMANNRSRLHSTGDDVHPPQVNTLGYGQSEDEEVLELNTLTAYGVDSAAGEVSHVVGELPTIAARLKLGLRTISAKHEEQGPISGGLLYSLNTAESIRHSIINNLWYPNPVSMFCIPDPNTSLAITDVSVFNKYVELEKPLPYIGTDADGDEVLFLPLLDNSAHPREKANTIINPDHTVVTDAGHVAVEQYIYYYEHLAIMKMSVYADMVAGANGQDRTNSIFPAGFEQAKHMDFGTQNSYSFSVPTFYSDESEYGIMITESMLTPQLGNSDGSNDDWVLDLTETFPIDVNNAADNDEISWSVLLSGSGYRYYNGALRTTAVLRVYYGLTRDKIAFVLPGVVSVQNQLVRSGCINVGSLPIINLSKQTHAKYAHHSRFAYVQDRPDVPIEDSYTRWFWGNALIYSTLASISGSVEGTERSLTFNIVNTTRNAMYVSERIVESVTTFESTAVSNDPLAGSTITNKVFRTVATVSNDCKKVKYVGGAFVVNDVPLVPESVYTSTHDRTADDVDDTDDPYDTDGTDNWSLTTLAVDKLYVNGIEYSYGGFRQSSYSSNYSMQGVDLVIRATTESGPAAYSFSLSGYYDATLPWFHRSTGNSIMLAGGGYDVGSTAMLGAWSIKANNQYTPIHIYRHTAATGSNNTTDYRVYLEVFINGEDIATGVTQIQEYTLQIVDDPDGGIDNLFYNLATPVNTTINKPATSTQDVAAERLPHAEKAGYFFPTVSSDHSFTHVYSTSGGINEITRTWQRSLTMYLDNMLPRATLLSDAPGSSFDALTFSGEFGGNLAAVSSENSQFIAMPRYYADKFQVFNSKAELPEWQGYLSSSDLTYTDFSYRDARVSDLGHLGRSDNTAIFHWIRKDFETDGICILLYQFVEHVVPAAGGGDSMVTEILEGLLNEYMQLLMNKSSISSDEYNSERDRIGSQIDQYYKVVVNNFASLDLMRLMAPNNSYFFR